MDQLNIPSESALINRDKLIKAVQELYQSVNALASTPVKAVPSPFKSSWRNSDTDSMDDFCADVLADSDAVVGMTFLGELKCTGLPASLSNGEARIDIVGETSSKIMVVTLYSLTTSPYHWEYTYPYVKTWRSWELSS